MAVPASICFPTRRRREYLAVALASVAPQAAEHGAEIIVVEDEAEDPADPRADRAPRRPLHRARRPEGHQRRPQRVRAARHRRPDLPARRRRPRLARLAGTRCWTPTATPCGGPIQPGLRGRALPLLRPRAAADHRARPRPGRHRRRVPLGREPRVPPRRVRRAPARSTPRWRAAATRRSGRRGCAAAGGQHPLRRRGRRRPPPRGPRRAPAQPLPRRLPPRARGAQSTTRSRARRRLPLHELRTLVGCVWHSRAARMHVGHRADGAVRGPRRGDVRPDAAPARRDRARLPLRPLGHAQPPHRARRHRRRTVLARAGRGVAVRDAPRRTVHVVGIVRPENLRTVARLRRELTRSKHAVELHLIAGEAGRGKWENLNAALQPVPDADWLLLVDDDVVLPRGFLDRFVPLAERFGFELAQPAHAFASHAAWEITRRRPGVLAHRTRFVEIGPIVALSRTAAHELLPFPDLRMGWGLDTRWSAIAAEHGWPIGVIDATPIRHLKPVAAAYPRDAAIAEADASARRARRPRRAGPMIRAAAGSRGVRGAGRSPRSWTRQAWPKPYRVAAERGRAGRVGPGRRRPGRPGPAPPQPTYPMTVAEVRGQPQVEPGPRRVGQHGDRASGRRRCWPGVALATGVLVAVSSTRTLPASANARRHMISPLASPGRSGCIPVTLGTRRRRSIPLQSRLGDSLPGPAGAARVAPRSGAGTPTRVRRPPPAAAYARQMERTSDPARAGRGPSPRRAAGREPLLGRGSSGARPGARTWTARRVSELVREPAGATPATWHPGWFDLRRTRLAALARARLSCRSRVTDATRLDHPIGVRDPARPRLRRSRSCCSPGGRGSPGPSSIAMTWLVGSVVPVPVGHAVAVAGHVRSRAAPHGRRRRDHRQARRDHPRRRRSPR